jgi:FkbM family methyltransferase
MKIRVKIIELLIHINEYLFFIPKLSKFYKNQTDIINPMIFDVGANKGQSIDLFLKLFKNPTIYAFEPNQTLCHYLNKKYINNKKIHVINKGVSETSGIMKFYETVTDETSTFEELNYNSNYLKKKALVLGVNIENVISKTYDVEVVSLKDFIIQNNISKVDLLKIDTEGHEYKCLLGLFDSNVVNPIYIQLESHNDDMYINHNKIYETENYLIKNKYKKIITINHGFGDFDEVIYKLNS